MSLARIYLLALLLLAVADGALAQLLYANPSGESIAAFAVALPAAILLHLWCKADARRRNIALPSGASILVPFIAIVGVPYYFFRTYTFGRAALHTALAVAFIVASSYAIWIGQMLVYYVQTG